MISNILSFWILFLFGSTAIIIQAWAAFDCLKSSPDDFVRANKRTKGFWSALTAGAVIVGALFLLNVGLGLTLLLNVAGSVVAGVYLADVRPAIQQVRGNGGSQPMGPYGPW
ncbi:DUF2516 family protein [Acaricomes phytoseiuli]|uniref:DUF2516 family protein n=1 Tax=Acaricomes phytoseiuli TaxID=291968 RepID=UPI000A050761|nr:DUF2516 family protein [Acaricomes phytoseiuli]